PHVLDEESDPVLDLAMGVEVRHDLQGCADVVGGGGQGDLLAGMGSRAQASGTMLTSLGARTMTLRTPAPPRARCAPSEASARRSSSSSAMSGDTSRRARTLPFTCTTAVTVSATRCCGSASGNGA